MTEIRTISGQLLFSFDENETTLAKEIEKHNGLAGADLTNADLEGADLSYVNLSVADLEGANLKDAKLVGADLEGANLKDAKLVGADFAWASLVGADLSGADLRGADLRHTDLIGAKLEGADFTDADIFAADFSRASGVPDIPLACPSKGSFTAWKKVGRIYLIKLEIPIDAKRSSATTNKCRCDKALVLDIEDLENGEHPNKVVNYNFCDCVYEVGKMVYPDSFDEDRWNECSNGIHFFTNKQDAVNY